jgi:RNA polymerase sigma factor (sigma-70 family)
MAMASDTTLARRAAAGDGAAFAALVERHYDRIFAFACRLAGDRTEAEDLTQDVCAALPGKLALFDGRAAVTTWLYRVVLNAARDRRRRGAARARAAAGWGDWETARQADAAAAKARGDWLRAAMERLGPDLAETVALVVEGLGHAEIGEILGISEGTVSFRVSQAKKRLKALRAAEEEA